MRKPACILFLAALLVLNLSGCDAFLSADQRIARAEQKRDAGNDRGAIIELQNLLKSKPDNIKARLLLADLSLRVGDAKAAQKELERAEQSGATDEQLAVPTAETKLALGQTADLISQLQGGTLPLPAAEKSLYLGFALFGSGKFEEASAAFADALQANPALTRARIGRARTFAQMGRTAEALADLQAVLEANPKDANAWSTRGSLLAATGEYKQAIAAYERARDNARGQLTPLQANAVLAGLAESQLALGEVTAARVTQSQLSSTAPDAALTQFLAARIAMAEQNYSQAVAGAQKAVAAAPDFSQAKLLLGAALLAKGSANQAVSQFAEILQHEPGNIEARKMLAQANLQLQRPDLAMQALAPIQAQTQDSQLDALRGWASLQSGEQDQAIALLERSVESQPQNADLKLDLAVAYLSAGANDKALDLLQSMPANMGGSRRDTLLLAAVNAGKGPQAAQAEAAKLVASRPKDIAALNVASAFALRQRDFAAARDYLNRALALDPKNAATILALGRVEMAAGDLDAAGKIFSAVSPADPHSTYAQLSLARIAAAKGDAADAVRRLEQMRKTDAKAIEPRLMLAALYMQQKKMPAADAVINEILASGSHEPKVLAAIAQLYLDSGRYDEATARFREAANQEPDNPAWLVGLARSQIALGHYSAARESAEKAKSLPNSATTAVALLVALDLRDGKNDAAAQEVADLRKARPNDPGAALLEGDVALNAKEFEAAALAYERSYKLRPSSAAAIKAYGARMQGKLPRPAAVLENWLQEQPGDSAARMVLASALAARGANDQAIEQYELLARDARPNPLALNNLAWLYFQQGDRRAAAIAKRAFDAAPQSSAIADTYGWILLKDKQVAQALPILERAAKGSNPPPEIRYHYAVALAEAGQRDRALQIIKEVTSGPVAFPEIADARRLLAELED